MSELNAKPVAQSEVVMTQLVLPSHTNALDSIFGGVVMSWIDIAAAVAAQRHSQLDVVTASLDELHFIAPVYKGWIVNLKARVNYVFRTSMEVGVRVEAENPKMGKIFHTASAYLTFVALSEVKKPHPVPSLILETDLDHRRFQEGEIRRKLRLQRRQRGNNEEHKDP